MKYAILNVNQLSVVTPSSECN